MKATFSSLTVGERNKIYIILASVCLILLFFSIRQSAPIIVEPGALLGFGSYLPVTYWIGLGLLLLSSIAAFLDGKLNQRAIFLFLLFVLGLYVIGMVSFVVSNPRNPESYYPSVVGNTLLDSGHLDISKPESLFSYRSWPGTQLLSAALVASTGADVLFLMKYAPVFWSTVYAILVYAFGARLGLVPNQSFALAFLALSSWFLQQDFSPAGIAIILYVSILVVLIPSVTTRGKVLLVLLLFAGLAITHGFTPEIVLLASAPLFLYLRRPVLLAVLLILFLIWYLYVATYVFESTVPRWWQLSVKSLLEYFQPSRYEAPAAVGRAFWRSTQLSYALLYAIILLVSGVLFLRKNTTGPRRRMITLLFLWLIGLAFGFLVPLGEQFARIYHFGLVVAAGIAVLTFGEKRLGKALIGLVMLVTVALNMPAHYGGEASWGQVLTSELKGAQFFAQQVNPRGLYFYYYSGYLIFHFNPDLATTPYFDPTWDARTLKGLQVWFPDSLDYAILSKQAHDRTLTRWGEDIYQLWPETLQGREAALIYDNGYFRIYATKNAMAGS